MSFRQRWVGMLILITLLVSPTMIFAQDASAVTVVGSGIATPLVNAFAEAAGVNTEVNVTGTNNGFVALCTGDATITTATRAMTPDEEAFCGQNGVSFLEFVLGYDLLAVVANPDVPATCLSTTQLNTVFAPSSTATNWTLVDTTNGDLPLSAYTLPDNTTTFTLLDDIVSGVGVRSDVTTLADSAAIIDAVSTTSGAVGAVSLPAALAAGDSVKILQLNTTTAGCAAPSAETAAGRTYTAAYTLYAYANSASVEAVQPIFAAAFAENGAEVIDGAGFIAPTAASISQDQAILAEVRAGRQFSRDVTDFSVAPNIVGTINVSGAASGSAYLTAVTGAFVQAYPGVTLNQTIDGQPDGVSKLCAGTADIINTFAPLSAEEQAACASGNIPTESISLGAQPVVLVGNGDFLTCLTTSEVTTLWGAPSEPTVTNWNQVNASFPDLPITLVAPAVGDLYGDLLLLTASGQNLPIREDFAETNASAAYRATAIGNVDGGVTYFNWQAFQSLSAETQARAIGIDAGNGCVTPSAATIADGSYALARPITLIVNRLSMARTEIQSLLWYLASDANFSLLANNGIVGLDFGTLPDLRDRLQQLYVQAADEAAQAVIDAANATPEVTAEATSDASADATPEATAEATAAS